MPQPPRLPVLGAVLREPQPEDSRTELFSAPRFEDSGGVNVRHPDREDCSEAEPPLRFEITPCDEDRFHELLLWPAANGDSSRDERFPKASLPARDDEKKCCEPDGALRKDEGSASRPAAL